MLLLGVLILGLICWLILRQLNQPGKEDFTKIYGECPECGMTVENGWPLCPNCQTRLRKSCPDCDQVHDVWFNFCPWCGGHHRGVTEHEQFRLR